MTDGLLRPGRQTTRRQMFQQIDSVANRCHGNGKSRTYSILDLRRLLSD
jgi:hypothetical protein